MELGLAQCLFDEGVEEFEFVINIFEFEVRGTKKFDHLKIERVDLNNLILVVDDKRQILDKRR